MLEDQEAVKEKTHSASAEKENTSEEDDWSNYPAYKEPSKYQLEGYCPMTGKEKFKKVKSTTRDEEVFTIFSSDDEDEDFLFEEGIQDLESNSYTENFAVTEEEEVDERNPSTKDFKRLASDSLAITRTLKDLNALQDYLNNEGNLPDTKNKCQECLRILK